MATNRTLSPDKSGIYLPTLTSQQQRDIKKGRSYDPLPLADPELIITAPLATRSSSYINNFELHPDSTLGGAPITGQGALTPQSISSLSLPGAKGASDSQSNILPSNGRAHNHLHEHPDYSNGIHPNGTDIGTTRQQPQDHGGGGADSDHRERLKSAGTVASQLSANSEQPLEPTQEPEEEKVPFKDLTCGGKLKRIFVILSKPVAIITCLYFFICSLNLLSSAFILIGGRMAGNAFGSNPLLSNPVCGLMIGVVSTAFLQSSSTSTSIIVTMVSSNILSVQLAIPIIMGSNIGTSVTGIFVAVTQAGDRSQFEKAFSAATVHDMFNWLTVITLLPLEILTGYLYHLTSAIVSSVKVTPGGSKQQFLSALTEPFTNLIVQVDKHALEKIAAEEPGSEKLSLLKYWCETKSVPANTTKAMLISRPPGRYIFHGTSLSEPAVGILVLIIALAMLITCLILMVKILKSLLQSSMAKAIQKTIGADFPGKAACLTGYVALLVGAVVTILVQSSSVVASALTPLVGLGVVTVERVYPMMLGANIGTTSTAILAAFAASSDRFRASFQVAMCHLFFNLSGILIWYPLPFMRALPINLAKFLGRTTATYRWFAFVYILAMFFILPLLIFALSIPGWQVLVGVASPLILLAIVVIIMNILQKYKPQWLPEKLRTWEFLPECLRSLAPLDRRISQLISCCSCCRCCKCCPKCDLDAEAPTDAMVVSSTADFTDVYGISSTDQLVPNNKDAKLSQSQSISSDVTFSLPDPTRPNIPSNFESSV